MGKHQEGISSLLRVLASYALCVDLLGASGVMWQAVDSSPNPLLDRGGEGEDDLHLIYGDDAQDFFDGGLAGGHAAQTILIHGLHPLPNGNFLEGARGQLLKDGIAENLIGDQ